MSGYDKALKVYVNTTAVAVCLYLAAMLYGVVAQAFGASPSALVATGLVVATIVAIGFHLTSMLWLVRVSDEFMRGLMAKRLLISAVVVIAAATVWGLCERWLGAPHIQADFLYSGFFVVHAALIPFINADR